MLPLRNTKRSTTGILIPEGCATGSREVPAKGNIEAIVTNL